MSYNIKNRSNKVNLKAFTTVNIQNLRLSQTNLHNLARFIIFSFKIESVSG